MDKNTLLLIFVLFLLSSQLWNVSWTIGTSAFYIVIIISVLNYISPESAITMKRFIIKLVNLDFKLVTHFLSMVSKFILSFFNNSYYKKIKNIYDRDHKHPLGEEDDDDDDEDDDDDDDDDEIKEETDHKIKTNKTNKTNESNKTNKKTKLNKSKKIKINKKNKKK